MRKELAEQYYSRPEIQKAILNFAKDREIAVMYNGYYGKRPDVIEYLTDVKRFVEKGAFSFHCSEERWANPLLLGTEKKDEDRDNNRAGWDLILDLDGVDYIYSRFLGKVILDYFDEIGIKNVSTKFSGNKGFHIGIPFEAFSKDCFGLVEGISESRLLFPDVAKRTVLFLLVELKEKISQIILDHDGGGMTAIKKISEKYKIPEKDLKYDKKTNTFDFMKVIDIDTILITSRHLFRMPYSLNEKSGLVSVPIANDKVSVFERNWARPQNVKPEYNKNFEFLAYDPKYGQDGNKLLEKVYSDFESTFDVEELVKEYNFNKRDIEGKMQSLGGGVVEFEIDQEVRIEDFPKTISFALKHKFEDGRKRALFLLITFLTSIKWTFETIERIVDEWNQRQEVPLKNAYVKAQMSWFKVKEKPISPPNFANPNYYVGIGIPQEIVEEDKKAFKGVTIKNPLHYVFILLKRKESKPVEKSKTKKIGSKTKVEKKEDVKKE